MLTYFGIFPNMDWYLLGSIMKDWKNMTDTWLTVKEVAQYLKLSPDLIYKLAQQGKIPASKVGTAWRFKREKVDQWMEANENRHGSPDR
jgi:excisionase family DNA binding protein